MATIAIIGSDGSGKTTIIKKLQKNYPLPMKYIYMGLNLESSNYLLPSSRLILKQKLRSIKKKAVSTGNMDLLNLSTHHIDYRTQKRNMLFVTFRTINRLAEIWYRQIISWSFQACGYLVIYDRHFLFDTALNPEDKNSSQNDPNRVFRWFSTYFFPRTDLVIFLDAPPEILLQRQNEVPLEYLITQRAALLAQGRITKNFLRIDASQPIEKVYTDVTNQINKLNFNKKSGRK